MIVRIPALLWRCLPALLLATVGAGATAEPLIDPRELEQWADEYYGRAIREHRSPGITVSVVQDGAVIFAKGYGYADYGSKIPVDPATSGFIVGSITKTFIGTALGQLVDRGLIASFDDPANRYLKRVQLPGTRGARVTIRQLLTHRAGFEDVNFGQGDPAGASVALPLPAAEIERFMPELVLEPGGASVYSNWGFSLLGFLIEDVTGQRIDTYLRENIWQPLGMTHTSLVYGRLPDNLSRAYWFAADGTPVAQPAGLPHPWIGPAGAIVSTAADMARYMNAHILMGAGGTPALVSPATFRELHTEHTRNAPISHGFALPFFTGRINDAATIEHGGGAPGFQSMMLMIPERRLGFFASAMIGGPAPGSGNAQGKAAGMTIGAPINGFVLRQSFVKRFLQPAPETAPGPPVDPRSLVGLWWQQRRAFTNIEILAEAFGGAGLLEIGLADDGQALLLNGKGPYRQLGGGVFASPTGQDVWEDPYTLDLFQPPYLAFNVDRAGRPVSFVPGLADQVWVPASPLFNPRSMLRGFIGGGALVVTGLLLWAWPQRRRFASPANFAGAGMALAVLAIPAALFLGFAPGESIVEQMIAGDRTRFVVMIAAAHALLLLTAVLLFRLVPEWPGGGAGLPRWAERGRRLHLAGVAAAAVVVLVALGFFKLLGWHIPS